MTPEEKADLLQDCDLLAPAGDATTTRLNGGSIRRVVKAARAWALAQTNPPTPAEWKLVPIEPTKDMIEAGSDNNPTCWNDDTERGFPYDVANDVYRAMVRASPPAPAVAQDGEGETRKLTDPFTGQEVEISDNLIDRLRGKYASGPTLANGEPEFGWRQMPTVPIQVEAAGRIEALLAENARLRASLSDANRLLDESVVAITNSRDHRDRAEADANRLAEALRVARGSIPANYAASLYIIDSALAEHDKGVSQ